MKKRILRIITSIVGIVCTFSIYGFSPQLDGTMMPYDFDAKDSVTPWGKDMKPVFVNYVARHGARFLSSAKKTATLKTRLTEAQSEGRLTEKGKHFLGLIEKVDSVTDGRWGALSEVGMEEENRLGMQLASVVPTLLKEGRVTAESSYVPRVVMTMYEFTHALARYSSDLQIYTAEGKQFNPLLRFFTTDKPYENYLEQGPWRYAYDNYAGQILPVAPAAALINEVADKGELQKLSLDMYGVVQSLPAAGLEEDASEWFTEEEYADCWKVSNLKHYYQRSASVFSHLPEESALPLLKRLADNADLSFTCSENGGNQSMEGKNTTLYGDLKADLLFGHAETVMPLFALMRLPGCYAPECREPQEVAEVWKDWEVSPLGANLLMVCLEDTDGKPYVALRLNGSWISIGDKKVIPWPELKAYWRL